MNVQEIRDQIMIDIRNQIPENIRIKSAYPNPFNPAINVNYSLSKPGNITLKIISISGTEICKILYDQQSAGEHTFRWNPEQYIASGVYIFSISSEYSSANRKLLYIK